MAQWDREAWWQAQAVKVSPEPCPWCGMLSRGQYETTPSGQAIVQECLNGHRKYLWIKEYGDKSPRRVPSP